MQFRRDLHGLCQEHDMLWESEIVESSEIRPAGLHHLSQDWENVVFLHFREDASILEPLIPQGTTLDTFEGSAWVSLVLFTVRNARSRNVPALPYVSGFHEINLRTYVTDGSNHGICLLDVEANKKISVWLSKTLTGIDYRRSDISRTDGDYRQFFSKNAEHAHLIDLMYKPGCPLPFRTPLDTWLTERYSVFLEENQKTYRFDIHHYSWPLHRIEFSRCICRYEGGALSFREGRILKSHYSPGLKVHIWPRREINIHI